MEQLPQPAAAGIGPVRSWPDSSHASSLLYLQKGGEKSLAPTGLNSCMEDERSDSYESVSYHFPAISPGGTQVPGHHISVVCDDFSIHFLPYFFGSSESKDFARFTVRDYPHSSTDEIICYRQP